MASWRLRRFSRHSGLEIGLITGPEGRVGRHPGGPLSRWGDPEGQELQEFDSLGSAPCGWSLRKGQWREGCGESPSCMQVYLFGATQGHQMQLSAWGWGCPSARKVARHAQSCFGRSADPSTASHLNHLSCASDGHRHCLSYCSSLNSRYLQSHSPTFSAVEIASFDSAAAFEPPRCSSRARA